MYNVQYSATELILFWDAGWCYSVSSMFTEMIGMSLVAEFYGKECKKSKTESKKGLKS